MRNKVKEISEMQPKIRFPQFRGSGGWQQSTIGKLGSFYYGKSAPKWSLSADAPTLCVRYGELYTKFGTIISEITSRTNTDPANLRFSKGGEILIPRVGEKPQDFANCCYLPFPNIAIGEMISVYETRENPIFYTYYFRTLRKEFAQVVEGQNVKNLYFVNLEPIIVGKPSYAEQTRIADCLSSLDELIAAENEKLGALKQHKKGLMQELFPIEGQVLPNQRFPEFKNAPEWETQDLGEIARFVNDRIALDELSTENYISTENILPDFLGITKASKLPSSGSATRYTTNDILVSNIRPYLKKVWVADKNGGASNDVIVIRNKSRVTNKFLAFMLRNDAFIDYVMKGAKGVKMPRGDINLMKVYPVKYPSDKSEQKKIADTLSSMDELIAAQSQKIDSLQIHKKGLMQNLFPVISGRQK